MERGKYFFLKSGKNKIEMGLFTLDYHFISHLRKSFLLSSNKGSISSKRYLLRTKKSPVSADRRMPDFVPIPQEDTRQWGVISVRIEHAS